MGAREESLQRTVARLLARWPTAGLAVAVIGPGESTWFHTHGVADVTSRVPVTPDTVFRIGSLTKTFTAVAILQLCEQGRVDLDVPANEYLRTFRLRPARPEDAGALVLLEERCFPDPWSEAAFAITLAGESTDAFVAEDAGVPVGYVVTLVAGESAEIVVLHHEGMVFVGERPHVGHDDA